MIKELRQSNFPAVVLLITELFFNRHHLKFTPHRPMPHTVKLPLTAFSTYFRFIPCF
ncbi:MAG: hypothetical protein IJ432_02930 [Clostridia bacterium]|nr:hypothetical protein [Clostridia bacterium]